MGRMQFGIQTLNPFHGQWVLWRVIAFLITQTERYIIEYLDIEQKHLICLFMIPASSRGEVKTIMLRSTFPTVLILLFPYISRIEVYDQVSQAIKNPVNSSPGFFIFLI